MQEMTPEQSKLFNEIDQRGYITEDDLVILPGLHFCHEWDGLLIWDGLPAEMDCCICPLIDNPT